MDIIPPRKPIQNQTEDLLNSGQTMPDNNPFAIYSNINTDKFFGVKGVRDRGEGKESLLQFDNIQNGLRAGFYNLRKKYNKKTIAGIVDMYSRTDKEGYKKYLEQKLDKGFILDANNNESIKKLATAIMGFETGEKAKVLNTLNITDKDLDYQIERSKEELEDSIYSQMKKIKL